MEAIDRRLFSGSASKCVVVYTPPKVGSTTLITSLRVSLGRTAALLHVHDDLMLNVLAGTTATPITVKSLIAHIASNRARSVFVVDVYRTPVERKMSEFFEKLATVHFNAPDEVVAKYSVADKITPRFNRLWPHLAASEHSFSQWGVALPSISSGRLFDVAAGVMVDVVSGVSYVRLRLCDAPTRWAAILSQLFGQEVVVIPDYKTSDKGGGIGELYRQFVAAYRLPEMYLRMLADDRALAHYYSAEERERYLTHWGGRVVAEVGVFSPFSPAEYALYMQLCVENQVRNEVDTSHYIDEGCECCVCERKRHALFLAAKRGKAIEKSMMHITHVESAADYHRAVNRRAVAVAAAVSKLAKTRTAPIAPKKFGPNVLSLDANIHNPRGRR